jgi:hypothetical protein
MATFKSFEPKQRGIPSPRYTRPLVRTNALVQDANCMQPAAAPAPAPVAAKFGWGVLNQGNLEAPVATANAGTMQASFSGHALAFGLTDLVAGDTGTYTVASAFTGDTTGWGVNWAGTSGVLTIPNNAAFGVTGSVTLTLNRNGIPVGQLQALVVAQANMYGDASWLAYSPV